MCGLTVRPSLYATLLGRNKLRKRGKKDQSKNKRTGKTAEDDFVLNVCPLLVLEMVGMCAVYVLYCSVW
jgi:hypothetical protein